MPKNGIWKSYDDQSKRIEDNLSELDSYLEEEIKPMFGNDERI